MASRTYSASELLRMRRSSPSEELACRLQARLFECPELNEIARKPFERSLGMKLTRIPEETARETSGDSSDSMPLKRHAPRQFDGTEHEWKYAGRNESEEAEPQPISAPAGLEAQKMKGFQRFYQAVVSPTHVRVTAGGRIVPNNRSSSPTTKYAKEKAAVNDAYGLPQRPATEQTGFPFSPSAYGPFPMYPGFPPGVGPAGGIPPHPPYMMPWPMPVGLGMGPGFAMPPPNSSHFSQQHPSLVNKEVARGDKRSESGVSENVNPSQAPGPELMDASRNAFYGAPMMLPPGGHFFPYPMAPPAGFPAGPYGIPMMAPHPMSFDQQVRPPTNKTNTSVENEASSSNPKSPSAFVPPTHPPVSSIRPSEITRRHLDILRSRLKYLEDQLSYNKHQIDEKAVNYDAQTVRQYIAQFEKTLESQLASKEGQYQKSVAQQESGAVTPSRAATARKSAASSDTKSLRERSSYSDHASIGYSAGKKLSKSRSATKTAPAQNPSQHSTSAFAEHGRTVSSPISHIEANSKSSLSRAAAMAAPFQPRLEASGRFEDGSHARRSDTSSLSAQDDPRLGSRDSRSNGRRQLPWPQAQASAREDLNVPYLVGQLPHGSKSGYSKDVSYVYDRPLTEDELRARHMYWGKTPRELQKGLPVFNGKDFFPPSPVKARSSEASSGSEGVVRARARYAVPIVKPNSDPFHSLGETGPILTRDGPGHSTQSEALPRPEQGSADEQLTVASSRTMPPSSRVGCSLDGINRGSEETAPTSSEGGREKFRSDETEEEREIIFTGRKTMGRSAGKKDGIWSSMLKKTPASANAIPSTLTSATAQGVLPHYAGHATASLTPTITNKAASPRKVSKVFEGNDSKLVGSVAQKRGEENCPPCETFGDIS